VPAQHLRAVLGELAPRLDAATPLVLCAKGIEEETGKLLSEIVAELAPDNPFAVLSGPTFAAEVAAGLPTAVTVASSDQALTARLAEALATSSFRPYASTDPTGAELGGALKNVIAIACGIVEGAGLGANARAALMTRGLAEIVRLGVRLGAKAETFLGLSGLGDLTLTCNSLQSRNCSLGVALGEGRALADILAERQAVTEGVATSAAAVRLARRLDVDMPVVTAVDGILHSYADIGATIRALLARPLKAEA
jgi:glycerol-3-phosphate dehydrogenase (NAD(P)+)